MNPAISPQDVDAGRICATHHIEKDPRPASKSTEVACRQGAGVAQSHAVCDSAAVSSPGNAPQCAGEKAADSLESTSLRYRLYLKLNMLQQFSYNGVP
jgi:hypothetical protein